MADDGQRLDVGSSVVVWGPCEDDVEGEWPIPPRQTIAAEQQHPDRGNNHPDHDRPGQRVLRQNIP